MRDGMKYWIAFAAAIAAIVCLSWCAHAECVASGRAVLAGGAKHATWRLLDGHKCWTAGYPSRQRHAPLRQGRSGALQTAAVPLPRPNPLDAPLHGMYSAVAAELDFMMFGPACPPTYFDCRFANGR